MAGFVGVVTGAWLTSRRERTQRKLDFCATQLKDFYSPMLGLRSEIRMLSELRLRIQNTALDVLEDRTKGSSKTGPAILSAISATSEHEKLIEYDNKQLREDLLPAYREMAKLFRDNYWLADTDTRAFYRELIEYVEIWNRSQANTIPGGVLQRLGHAEAKLHPFYEHLQQKHDSLRKKIEDGEP